MTSNTKTLRRRRTTSARASSRSGTPVAFDLKPKKTSGRSVKKRIRRLTPYEQSWIDAGLTLQELEDWGAQL